jgi:hypothetical protein
VSFNLPGGSGPAAPALPATTPAAPPAFGSAPQGTKPQAKANQPTFLGAQLQSSPSNSGGKTLLGT